MTVAHHFGAGKSTVGVMVVKVCEAINPVIYTQMVDIRNVPEIFPGFQRMGFPNCTAVIVCQSEWAREFVNHNGYHHIILQGMADHRGRFLNTEMESTGKVHDAKVLRRFAMYLKWEAGTLFPNK